MEPEPTQRKPDDLEPYVDYIDDIAGRLTAAAIAFAVAGLALAALSAIALGGVRAAEKWPSAPAPRVSRPIALAGAMAGLVVFALAVALFSLARFGTGLDPNLRVLLAVGLDLVALGIGVVAVNTVAGKVEVRALIAVPDQPMNPPPIPVSGDPTRYQVPDYNETPTDPEGSAPQPHYPTSPFAPDTASTGALPDPRRAGGVPTIPTDTRPGWVFQDRGTGAYYAAVAQSRGGISLLALDDFTVARTASLVGPLELVGSVEATVWPLENGNGDTGTQQAGAEATR
ncbi:hypothetical protein [Glycomyces buryatensis]|uniref:Uncharacterized protein n=1 Tax=Glycomyces buryatensis TaxID=2570927 RepID=A0A4S8QL04_9ACTN|nr:hypothetical protein [Glycomyces buryatensis]THV41404.1 hypothetical protein FAB82_11425 [Glycomyces buryatensis]